MVWDLQRQMQIKNLMREFLELRLLLHKEILVKTIILKVNKI